MRIPLRLLVLMPLLFSMDPATARAAFDASSTVAIREAFDTIAEDSAAAGGTASASGPHGSGSATTHYGSHEASASSTQWSDPIYNARTNVFSSWNDRIRVDGATPGTPLSIFVSIGIVGYATSVEGATKANSGSFTYAFELGTPQDGFASATYSKSITSAPGYELLFIESFGAQSYAGGVLVQRFDLEYGAYVDISSRLHADAVEGGSAGTTAATTIEFGLPPGATLTSDSGVAYATPEPDAAAAALTTCAALAARARWRRRIRSAC